jgi:hypothetical protein
MVIVSAHREDIAPVTGMDDGFETEAHVHAAVLVAGAHALAVTVLPPESPHAKSIADELSRKLNYVRTGSHRCR